MRAIGEMVSLEEYLHNPKYERSEWVEGEIVERGMGTGQHGSLTGDLCMYFRLYFKRNPIGDVGVEVHCHFKLANERIYRIPDVAVILGQRMRDIYHIEGAPAIAIEVRSPDESVASQLAKCYQYLDAGGLFAVLVVPEAKTVHVLQPQCARRELTSTDILAFPELLPGFELSLAELFN